MTFLLFVGFVVVIVVAAAAAGAAVFGSNKKTCDNLNVPAAGCWCYFSVMYRMQYSLLVQNFPFVGAGVVLHLNLLCFQLIFVAIELILKLKLTATKIMFSNRTIVMLFVLL